MEDSLEDYIRISKNKKQDNVPPIKKEVLVTEQIKRECTNRAMKIVELCIDGKLRSEALLNCLLYINPEYYQDIVEERAISKLCGYPLCGKAIPEMPKKQYHISTKQNKIYDITDRKNYCSNYCYKASIHIKKQIDDSPLWLRKYETIPKFDLLRKTEGGLPGEEIDQGIAKPVTEPTFTPVSIFTKLSLDEMVEKEINFEKSVKKHKKPLRKVSMQTISEKAEDLENSKENNETLVENLGNICNERTISEENVQENSELCQEEQLDDSSKPIKKPNGKKDTHKKKKHKNINENIEVEIIKVFKEWISFETFIFIYGEDKIKEIINDEKLNEYFDSLKIAELQVEQQKKYLEICKKLHLRELAETKFDAAITGSNSLKPIPDYRHLKEESKMIDLKVKSFYSGALSIEEDKNFPQKKIEENVQDDSVPVVLPLLDVTSQNALRRKIFLNSLNKAMEQLLEYLNIGPSTVLPEVQQLVKTFKLKANNIVFKPFVWNYIALTLIEVLAIKNKTIQSVLNQEHSKAQLQQFFTTLPLKKERFIDTIVDIIKDVDNFTKYYITSNESS